MVEVTLLRAQGLAVMGGCVALQALQRAACCLHLLPSHLLSTVLNVCRWGDEAGEADMRVTDIADTGPWKLSRCHVRVTFYVVTYSSICSFLKDPEGSQRAYA